MYFKTFHKFPAGNSQRSKSTANTTFQLDLTGVLELQSSGYC